MKRRVSEGVSRRKSKGNLLRVRPSSHLKGRNIKMALILHKRIQLRPNICTVSTPCSGAVIIHVHMYGEFGVPTAVAVKTAVL
jgi:hypothetical protein